MNKTLLTLVTLAGAISASATESCLTKTGDGLTDATVWTIQDDFPSPDIDYVNKGSYTLQTSGSSDTTFLGHSLTIGDVATRTRSTLGMRSGSGNRRLEFPGEGGLILSAANLDCWHTYCNTIVGNVTVTSTEEWPVYLFAANQRDAKASASIIFDAGTFSGAETACCHSYIKQQPKSNGYSTEMRLQLLSDTSAYYGRFKVSAFREEQEPVTNKYSVLQLGRYPFGGTVDLRRKSALEAVYADSVVEIAHLAATNKSVLTFLWDGANNTGATYRVTGSLSVNAPIEVRPSKRNNYVANAGFRLALLKAPAGTTLNPDDWTWVNAPLLQEPTVEKDLPNVELLVADDVDGLSTLWVQARPVITMTASDSGSGTKSGSFVYDSAAPTNNWSNGAYPTDDFDYLSVGYAIRPPSGSTVERTFAGHSLTLRNCTLALRCKRVTVADLRADLNLSTGNVSFDNYGGGTQDYPFASGGTMYVAGNLYVSKSSKSYVLNLVLQRGRQIAIESDVSGDGDIAARLANSEQPLEGYAMFSGDNTGWSGRLTLNAIDAVLKDPTYAAKVEVRFAEGCNLGGPMKEFTFNATDITRVGRLVPTGAQTTLDEPTRGILARHGAQFVVSNDVCFTVKERITYSGTLSKTGTGRLRLGGGRPLFTEKALETPLAGTNVLAVCEGSLTPASSEAFKGVAVSFASGTSIVLDHPDDAEESAARYGMDLTDDLSSLSIADATLPVSFAATESTKCGFAAICTVKSADAAALRGKFVFANAYPYGDNRCAQLVEIANGDGTVTFGAKLNRGLMLLVR